MMVRGVVEWFNFIYTWMIYCFTVYIVYLSMLEQATFLSLKLEFENMVMSMLIGNPDRHNLLSVDEHLNIHKYILLQLNFQIQKSRKHLEKSLKGSASKGKRRFFPKSLFEKCKENGNQGEIM